jgi:hypothetical protein
VTTDYLDLAKQAFDASTNYINGSYRNDWDYSLRAFRNEHPSGSKYLSEDYKGRSKLFRPNTRSIIRKNEAAAAVSLFSNMDVVNLTPSNPDDVFNVASAACMKEILEYRLTKTIPAFPLVMGAIQDAQTTGTVCSYQYWDYLVRDGRKIKDKPCIELRPIENIRLDGGANWLDPVGTSPYFCDIVPMYVCDVKGMMESSNDKTGEPKWKKYEDKIIALAKPELVDSTHQARLGKQQDPEQESTGIKSFDIVWVMRWFMKNSQGDDEVFYTLGTEALLTDAKPIEEVYFHGKRPYVIGCAIIETHKALKSSVPTLIRPVQQEINDVANQRLDNVKFVLNKRWLVARGRQTDVQSLVRNVPGGVTMTSNPREDIVAENWPDVTSSSFVEQDRLKSELDDLAGNFSPNTRVANNAMNDTLGGSKIAAAGAGLMSDYLLRTVIETWWEPVLRQLVLLERYYETDEVVLGICAQKARLFQKFGISKITDMMLMNEIDVNVNVGMGSSNPNERFQKFIVATKAATELVATAPPGFNVKEGIKEIFSNAGYRDGARFFSDEQDPRLIKAMQVIQQMQGALEGKQMELQSKERMTQAQIASNERIKGAEIQVNASRIHGDLRVREGENALEAARLELERLIAALEAQGMEMEQVGKLRDSLAKLEESKLKIEHEHIKNAGLLLKIQDQNESRRADSAS